MAQHRGWRIRVIPLLAVLALIITAGVAFGVGRSMVQAPAAARVEHLSLADDAGDGNGSVFNAATSTTTLSAATGSTDPSPATAHSDGSVTQDRYSREPDTASRAFSAAAIDTTAVTGTWSMEPGTPIAFTIFWWDGESDVLAHDADVTAEVEVLVDEEYPRLAPVRATVTAVLDVPIPDNDHNDRQFDSTQQLLVSFNRLGWLDSDTGVIDLGSDESPTNASGTVTINNITRQASFDVQGRFYLEEELLVVHAAVTTDTGSDPGVVLSLVGLQLRKAQA